MTAQENLERQLAMGFYTPEQAASLRWQVATQGALSETARYKISRDAWALLNNWIVWLIDFRLRFDTI